jgi:hypothetical protein
MFIDEGGADDCRHPWSCRSAQIIDELGADTEITVEDEEHWMDTDGSARVDGSAESTVGIAAHYFTGDRCLGRERLGRVVIGHDDLQRTGGCLGIEIGQKSDRQGWIAVVGDHYRNSTCADCLPHVRHSC